MGHAMSHMTHLWQASGHARPMPHSHPLWPVKYSCESSGQCLWSRCMTQGDVAYGMSIYVPMACPLSHCGQPIWRPSPRKRPLHTERQRRCHDIRKRLREDTRMRKRFREETRKRFRKDTRKRVRKDTRKRVRKDTRKTNGRWVGCPPAIWGLRSSTPVERCES